MNCIRSLSINSPAAKYLKAEYVASVVPTRNSLSQLLISINLVGENRLNSQVIGVTVQDTYERSRTSGRIDSPKKISSGFNYSIGSSQIQSERKCTLAHDRVVLILQKTVWTLGNFEGLISNSFLENDLCTKVNTTPVSRINRIHHRQDLFLVFAWLHRAHPYTLSSPGWQLRADLGMYGDPQRAHGCNALSRAHI